MGCGVDCGKCGGERPWYLVKDKCLCMKAEAGLKACLINEDNVLCAKMQKVLCWWSQCQIPPPPNPPPLTIFFKKCGKGSAPSQAEMQDAQDVEAKLITLKQAQDGGLITDEPD